MTELPSELTKTRRFQPKPEPVTAPFVRVVDDKTVRFSRPYERIELEANPKPVEQIELDLSTVQSIGDDTLPFSLESEPIERVDPIRESEPYDLIEMRLSLPAVAEPLLATPVPQRARIQPGVVIAVIVVLISAFASGVGLAFAL